MLTFSKTLTIDKPAFPLPFDLEKALFFDIETTGFTYKTSKIYLIGCISFTEEKGFSYTQFFCEDGDEASLLHAFFAYIHSYSVLLHFNGTKFDIPYIEGKCKDLGLDYGFEHLKEQYDLYKEALKYKNFFKIPNFKQKTLEEFFDLHREDTYSGGELIQFYHNYRKKPSEILLQTLLLHNAEDLSGMLSLLGLFSYDIVFSGNFCVSSCCVKEYLGESGILKKEILFELHLDTPVAQKISGGNEIFYFYVSQNLCQLKVSVLEGELKFYYPNYKNYYYLPEQDYAIHKSAAFLIENTKKEAAKASNCYTKKSGLFLPQKEEIVGAGFQEDYRSKTCYFELTDDFLENKELQKKYILHVLTNYF